MISDSSASETGAALEDVRSSLFSELKERGLLSSVKAQLRGKVVQELQSLAKDRPVSVESSTQRWGRVCVSVLAEYLQITGLEYTLSVLLIEGGCGSEGVMGRGEIQEILRIRPRDLDSILTCLVEEFARDRGVQKRYFDRIAILSLVLLYKQHHVSHACQLSSFWLDIPIFETYVEFHVPSKVSKKWNCPIFERPD